MAKGITEKEPDPRIVYADIIDLPHHQSSTHPRMPLYKRAAQFAAYKALSGYEEMIAEESRLTEREISPEEQELNDLNRKLARIAELNAGGEYPLLTFRVFVPDGKKAGGHYTEITDRVKRIDTAGRKLVLLSRRERSGINESIPLDRIADIRGGPVDEIFAE